MFLMMSVIKSVKINGGDLGRNLKIVILREK